MLSCLYCRHLLFLRLGRKVPGWLACKRCFNMEVAMLLRWLTERLNGSWNSRLQCRARVMRLMICLIWMLKLVMGILKEGTTFFSYHPEQILQSPLLARFLKVQQAGRQYTGLEDGSPSWSSSQCWKKYLSSTRVHGFWLGWNV